MQSARADRGEAQPPAQCGGRLFCKGVCDERSDGGEDDVRCAQIPAAQGAERGKSQRARQRDGEKIGEKALELLPSGASRKRGERGAYAAKRADRKESREGKRLRQREVHLNNLASAPLTSLPAGVRTLLTLPTMKAAPSSASSDSTTRLSPSTVTTRSLASATTFLSSERTREETPERATLFPKITCACSGVAAVCFAEL